MSYLTLFATSYFLDDNYASDMVDESAIYADVWGRSTIDCKVYWSRGWIMRRTLKDYNGIWGNNSNMLLPILVIYCSTTIAPSSKTNDNNNNNNDINNDDENYEDNTDIGSDKYSENQ